MADAMGDGIADIAADMSDDIAGAVMGDDIAGIRFGTTRGAITFACGKLVCVWRAFAGLG